MSRTAPQQLRSAVASSSRSYATKGQPATAKRAVPKGMAPPPDSRQDQLREILYPRKSPAPNSVSPVGGVHPDREQRVQAILPNIEYHETIERAWKLHRRHRAEAQETVIKQKFRAMERACDELNRLTRPVEKGGEGYNRTLYVDAMKRPDPWAQPRPLGRRISPEARWLEARIDGLMPREVWVPTDTRGKGWNYDWKRPASS